MKLFKWLDTWLEVYKMQTVREATYQNYKYAVQLIKSHTENFELEKYDEITLQLILNKLYQDNYAKSTIKLVNLTLNQAFQKALKQHYITENFADELKVPVMAHQKTVEALTLEEENIILKECRGDMYGDYIVFMLHTGLRKEEFCNLKWNDYSSQEKYIEIKKSKTVNGLRKIPLSQTAQIILDRQPKITEYIFVQRNAEHRPITKTVLRKACERMTKNTGVKITPHILRHTFATRIYELSSDVKSLSELLGHSNVAFTIQRYVTSNFDKKRQIISLL